MMATLAPAQPINERHIRDRLTYWREHLLEATHGTSNQILTLDEILTQLNYWLEQLVELNPTLGPCQLVEGETTCRGCGSTLHPTQTRGGA